MNGFIASIGYREVVPEFFEFQISAYHS